MRGLNNNQKQEILQSARQAKKQGEALSEVFKRAAQKYKMSPGSIRNFYYRSIAEGMATDLQVKKLKPFTKEEEKNLISSILRERKKCGSLRRALLNLANGNEVLALRYQNKFANLLKKQRSFIMREVLLQREREGDCFNPYAHRAECSRRARLKKEIDELVLAINQKCSRENAELRKKLIEYEKLCKSTPSVISYSNQVESDRLINYFSNALDKKSNQD